MSGLNIGLIGYRNHSIQIINHLLKSKKIYKITCYCYKKNKIHQLSTYYKNLKINFTNNLQDLLKSDAYFITSPSDTHVKYIKYFISENKPIFCEKTGLTNLKEYNFLNNLKKSKKQKIYFNYNFLYTELFKNLKKLYVQDKKDKLIHFNIYVTYGIAYLNKFKNNWRFNSKSILERISGNLGSHYLHFLINLLGNPNYYSLIEKKISTKNTIDTAIFNLNFKNNITGNLIFSYASPMMNEMTFLFSNKIIKIINNKLINYGPRNTFDSKGFFKTPKIKKIFYLNNLMYELSYQESVNFFLKHVINKKKFQIKLFNDSINISKLLLTKKI